MSVKPDFKKYSIYNLELYADDSILFKGFVNEKAWNKTIENSVLWIFVKDNGRVVEKIIEGYKLELSTIEIEDDLIILRLSKSDNVSYEAMLNSKIDLDLESTLKALENTIKKRKLEMPENSYTTHLFEKGEEKILKKMGEESIEIILAHNNKEELIYESADFIYHLIVLFVEKGISFSKVIEELKNRMDKK